MCLAVPGRLVGTSGESLTRSGRVDFGGVIKEVSLALVPEALVGDYLLVHVGFALTRVDEAEAQSVLEALRQLDALGEEGA